MNKIGYAAFLLAVSLEAQTGPAAQNAAPAQSEAAPKAQAQPPATETQIQERPITLDISKVLDRFDFNKPLSTIGTPTPCSIPLAVIPVPDKERYANQAIPANPSIDPKIFSAPPKPACAQQVVPTTFKPLNLDAKKK